MTFKGKKDWHIALLIFAYSALCKLLVSLHSIIYDKMTMEVDGICFYVMGKAIKNGKILYKDIFDHKTPYIYFINTLASFFEEYHIGLYILEVLVLFLALFYIYKFLKMVLTYYSYENAQMLAIIGAFMMSVVLNIRSISIGYNRSETYAVALLMPPFYIFTKFFLKEISVKAIRNYMFLIGVLAGLIFMINIRAVVLLAPFAIVSLVIFIKDKEYLAIVQTFINGILGVIVSIIPYAIYVITTDSFNEMVYALVNTNLSYNKSVFLRMLETPFGETFAYNPSDGVIATIIAYFRTEPMVMTLIALSFVLILVMKYNKSMKFAFGLSFLSALSYIMLSGRVHTYYLFVLLPFTLAIYIFIIKLLKNKIRLDNSKSNQIKTNLVVLCVAVITIFLSFIMNNAENRFQNDNCVKCSREMQQIVSKYNKDVSNLKVLAIGFRPEVYLWLDVPLSYKYFIIPSVLYNVDKTYCTEQYKYIAESDPDIVVVSSKKSFTNYPDSLKTQIQLYLNNAYGLLGEVKTIDEDVVYYVLGKI